MRRAPASPVTAPPIAARVMALSLALVTAGCGFLPARTLPAVPDAAMSAATVAGYSAIRSIDGEVGPLPEDALTRAARERLASPRPLNLLALSGGADGGAFGAGLLQGWTERGDRPQFDIVTGVSTGALIAPMAFLGPRYDRTLAQLYTESRTSDILLLRPLRVLSGAPSIGDNTPLKNQIAAIMTPQMVEDIAAERRRGRVLLVGTTNLDRQAQVIWDIGRIAASGHPDRVQLIRDILLASASVPGAFPPVAIDVTVNGKRYQELHVDGSVTRGVFVYPPGVPMPPARGPRDLWVVRNSKLSAEPAATGDNVMAIASRSLSTLIKEQSLSNIRDIEDLARRDGFRFHVTAVPPKLPLVEWTPFDPTYTATLYRAGVATGRSPRGWAGEVAPLLRLD